MNSQKRPKTLGDIILELNAKIDAYESVFQGFFMTNKDNRSTMSNIVMLNYIEYFAEKYESMKEKIDRVRD